MLDAPDGAEGGPSNASHVSVVMARPLESVEDSDFVRTAAIGNEGTVSSERVVELRALAALARDGSRNPFEDGCLPTVFGQDRIRAS